MKRECKASNGQRHREVRSAVAIQIFVLFLCVAMLGAAAPTLELAQGGQREGGVVVVPQGRTVTFEMAMSEGDRGEPTVIYPESVKHLRGRGYQSQTMIVQGRMMQTTTYTDAVAFMECGDCTVKLEGKQPQTLAVRVIPREEYDARYAAAQKTRGATLTCVCDKESVFVGEQVHCTVTLTVPQGSGVSDIGTLVVPGCGVEVEKQFERELVRVQGKVCEQYRGVYTVTPHSSGAVTIPPIAAAVEIPVPSRDPFSGGVGFGGLAAFFGEREAATIESAPTKLVVEALPQTSRFITAFGRIESARLALDKRKVLVGEPLKVLLIITGDAKALAQAAFDDLELPAGLTAYRVGVTRDTHVVTAEYILTADLPGEYEIAPQELTYFDGATKRYQSVATAKEFLSVSDSGRQGAQRSVGEQRGGEALRDESQRSERRSDESDNSQQQSSPSSRGGDPVNNASFVAGTHGSLFVSWWFIVLCALLGAVLLFWARVVEIAQWLLLLCGVRKRFNRRWRILNELCAQARIDALAKFFEECCSEWHITRDELFNRIEAVYGSHDRAQCALFFERIDGAAYSEYAVIQPAQRRELAAEALLWFSRITEAEGIV